MAECVPVDSPSGRVQSGFSLPFVAAMCLAGGVFAAIMLDALLALMRASVASAARGRNRMEAPARVVLEAVLCSSFGGAGFILFRAVLPAGSVGVLLGILGFMTGHSVAALKMAQRFQTPLERSLAAGALQLGALGLGAYVLTGLAAGLLIFQNMWTAMPLALIPILSLRVGLATKLRMSENFYETITALTLMLERAHPYTQGHMDRVGRTAEELGRRLGLSRARARLLREAAVLHDIGKIAVDERILDKPARLNTIELAHVRKHAEAGAEILSPVREYRPMAEWIRHHHERVDGLGYPQGLSNDKIPIESKIIAVLDAYDAMTGGDAPGECRPYRQPLGSDEAFVELKRCSGTQFDEQVVGVFGELLKEGAVL